MRTTLAIDDDRPRPPAAGDGRHGCRGAGLGRLMGEGIGWVDAHLLPAERPGGRMGLIVRHPGDLDQREGAGLG
jgi:hypothetical protein